MMNSFRNIFRAAFILLIIFEILAWTGVVVVDLEFTWRGLVGTSCAVYLFIEFWSWYFSKRRRGQLHAAAYVVAFFSVLFDALGDVNRWYGLYDWYDQLMHLTGGMASLIVMWSIFDRLILPKVKEVQGFITYVLAFGLASFSGILYEGEEYLEDVFTGSNRLGSGFDTANDLLLNVTGHILGIVLMLIISRIRKSHEHQTNPS